MKAAFFHSDIKKKERIISSFFLIFVAQILHGVVVFFFQSDPTFMTTKMIVSQIKKNWITKKKVGAL